MYEYLKAKSFSPEVFFLRTLVHLHSSPGIGKALAWRSGTQQKEPFVFHHSNCSRSAFSGSKARGNIDGERRTFSFTPVYKKCFPNTGSLSPRQAGLASGIGTDLDGTGRRWVQEVDGREGQGWKGPPRHGTAEGETDRILFWEGKESERNRSGQVRQGVLVFPCQQSEASWPMLLLCMELSHGFCIPKVDFVSFLNSFFFLFRGQCS